MSRRKYTFEQRLEVVMHYLATDEGYRLTSARFNVPRTQVRLWVAAYDVYGEEGLDNALTNIYDLIILDVMLPGIEGFKILQEIRKQKIESKVIMLTAKSMLEDKLTGFDAGSNVQIKVVRGLGYKLKC